MTSRRRTATTPRYCEHVAGCRRRPVRTTQVQLSATDRDRDRLAYYAIDLPDGVSLDARTGLVTVHPTTAGEQDLTFRVTDGAAHDEVTVHVTVRPHGAPIGEKVEAESYVAQHGWTDGGANFVENNPAASGGKNVGWTAAGNWLQYRVDVAQAGTYDLELRVANGTGAVAPDAVSLRDASGAVLATVSVPDTGGWATYQSVHVPVTLAAGDQIGDAVLRDRRLQPGLPAPDGIAASSASACSPAATSPPASPGGINGRSVAGRSRRWYRAGARRSCRRSPPRRRSGRSPRPGGPA